MDKIHILFFIGITVGIFVPIVEKNVQPSELLEEPLTVIERVFTGATYLWHLAISVLILVTLPAAIFKSVRNRVSKKQFMPIPFMTGLSFGFTFMGALGLISSRFSQ